MSFISYAQNFEDVMLWRALKHIENGFYIDIGAQDPVIDSVSLAFYEHGWRGVHVEPTDQYSKKLKEARPDELIEKVAIGNSSVELEFFEFADTGLSTADGAIAIQHELSGYTAVRKEVQVISMDSLLDKYSYRNVHWLKLDVEGFEKNVIDSWVESTIRPWVLVIESTLPLTQEQAHTEWEPLILEKGYSFEYFDGLNRFYVHQDHLELAQAFSMPPNVFDGFELAGTSTHCFAQRLLTLAQQAEMKAQQAEQELALVYASTSWRITTPLRRFSYFL